MCQNCDYHEILESAGLDPTENRIRVIEVIGNNGYPLTAADVFKTVERTQSINRVTVYRILDLLSEKSIIERLSTGGRAACYGMAPNKNHQSHPHFYCTECGQMDCLSPGSMSVRIDNLEKTFPGEIDRVEVRIDGTCKNCLK
ncbi:MAG: transcriptional repressor [Desulfobacterales bacterium]|nr:transcriptional repressor [Deltaproteobacteria bacterium]NNK93778.1 transcriptional repressor [Desulfobacterales bacterium]